MSILVDHQIKEAIEKGEIKVNPFDSSLINPDSLDIRLGNKFSWTSPTSRLIIHPGGDVAALENNWDTILERVPGWNPSFGEFPRSFAGLIDPLRKDSFKTTVIESEHYILGPRDFVLSCLLEDIELSDSLMSDIRGKSSNGRLGIANSSMAGLVDAEWSGVLTIELFNYSDFPLLLTHGMKIGQMVFHRTEQVEEGYSKKGRYYKQSHAFGSLGV